MNDMDNTTIIRIVAGLIFIGIMLVPAVFYLLTLSKALSKCAPTSRTMEPGMVWLMFIPLFNLVWQFLVVQALAKSLGNEFRARGITNVEPEPGNSIGLAMCICGCCAIIPLLGILAALVQLVLWIVYWVKISEYSRRLDQSGMMPPPYPGMPAY